MKRCSQRTRQNTRYATHDSLCTQHSKPLWGGAVCPACNARQVPVGQTYCAACLQQADDATLIVIFIHDDE